jgi:DNA-directed RNA polymerase specialized sigma24 family protein
VWSRRMNRTDASEVYLSMTRTRDDRGERQMSAMSDFDAFYRGRYTTLSRALILAIGNRDLAVEATDEAFTRAIERWPEVCTFDNPEGWVYRVGVNWAKSRLKSKSATPTGLLDQESQLDDLPEPELFTAVEALPIKFRAVVVARFFLDWSVEQTAVALDIPKGTVKTRQARAIRSLKRQLGDSNEF